MFALHYHRKQNEYLEVPFEVELKVWLWWWAAAIPARGQAAEKVFVNPGFGTFIAQLLYAAV